MAEWFVEAFDKEYLERYAHRDGADAARAVALVRRILAERALEDRPTLDCACGAGRHLGLLRQAGARAVGIDLSRDLLRAGQAEAKAAAGGESGGAGSSGAEDFPVARADMRALPFGDGRFGAVLSLFTSFGYFEDPADDGRFLAEVARILAPDGVFVLDFLNAGQVRAGLVPRSERALDGGERLIEERRIDEATGQVIKEARRVDRNGATARQWMEAVRLYDRPAVEGLARGAGLQAERVFGDYGGGAFGEGSPRLIVEMVKAQ